MKYEKRTDGKSGNAYRAEVHYWRPPCSCGVELDTAIQAEVSSPKTAEAKGNVHFWRPPCSCGVSLDEVVE